MEFAWHQDSGYYWGEPHTPWISRWLALDDMSEANGTLYLLPPSALGEPAGGPVGSLGAVLPHALTPGTNDLVGYTGDARGTPVVVKAGGMALFASTTLHRSGANDTGAPRRAHLASYSPAKLDMLAGTTRQNVRFLARGRRTHADPMEVRPTETSVGLHAPRL